jgi:hypothetical protein
MKSKKYATPLRTPMMAGGEAKRQKKSYGGGVRKKHESGEMVTQSAPKQGTKEKMTNDDRLYNSMKSMSTTSLLQIAGRMGAEANAARRILRDRGVEGQMPPGDQEPVGKMYGGKVKKKMMYGGKAHKGKK